MLTNLSATNKILIVQPEAEVREMLKAIFEKSGFEVIEAEDGIDALMKAKNESIDVILTALHMPRLDGISLIKKKNEDPFLKDVPIVFYDTVSNEEEKEEILKETGAKDYLPQGVISPEEIIQRTSRAIQQGDYYFKIDPYALDAQDFINDFHLGSNFKCTNDGSDLAIKLHINKDKTITANIVCPVCHKKYL